MESNFDKCRFITITIKNMLKEKAKPERSLSRLLFIVTINCFVLLILLGLLEAYCRFAGVPYKVEWVPQENAVARFDKDLGWSYIPNFSTTLSTRTNTIKVHFDKHGIRVPYSGFQLDRSKPSVLFIGGSFTMGHGLSYDESFVGKFSSFVEVPYQVINLGVQAYGSDQALLALKKFLPMFNVKVVVYTFIEDHITRNGNYDRRLLYPEARFLGTKPLFALDSKNELYLERKPLRYKDYINSWLIDALKLKLGRKLRFLPPYPEKLTKAIILEMKKYSENNGAHFVIFNWRWSEDDYNKLFNEMNVDIIDTLEDAPNGWKEMERMDKHPNAEANEHAARLLLKYFQSKEWFKEINN